MKILHFCDKHSSLETQGLERSGTSRYRLFSSILMAAGQAATCCLRLSKGPCPELPHAGTSPEIFVFNLVCWVEDSV